jgi:hypothetical protein
MWRGVSGVTVAGGISVIVDSNGHLGMSTCLARSKEHIQLSPARAMAFGKRRPLACIKPIVEQRVDVLPVSRVSAEAKDFSSRHEKR